MNAAIVLKRTDSVKGKAVALALVEVAALGPVLAVGLFDVMADGVFIGPGDSGSFSDRDSTGAKSETADFDRRSSGGRVG